MITGTIKRRRGLVFLLLVVIGALAFQLYEVDEPWVGLKDYNGVAYEIMSRNYLKHGYLETRFGQAINTGPVPDGEFRYYLHHPQIYYILVSFSYHLFGVHEWSARLVSILFSIISLFFFFRLVRKNWGVEEAYYSTFFLAFLPINLYFSRVFLQESAITLGTVLMLWYYMRWREGRNATDYWKIVTLFIFFGMVDWPAYYLLPLMTLHTLIVDRRSELPGKVRMMLLPIFGILLFLAYLAYCNYLSQVQGGAGLLDSFIFRSVMKTVYLEYSTIDFLRMEAFRSYHLFTPFVIILSLIWLFYFLTGKAKHDFERNLLVLFLILFGAIHVILFRDASYIHEFWLFHLCTGIALSAGIALHYMMRSTMVEKFKVIRPLILYAIPVLFLLFSAREVIRMHRVREHASQAVAGMLIHEMSEEEDRIIIHWEDPVAPKISHYFRYYGPSIYNKPMPHIACYADRNIRWGLKDVHDFEALMNEESGRYTFFITAVEYMRNGMDEGIKSYLLKHFIAQYILDHSGEKVDVTKLHELIESEEIALKRGLVIFRRKGTYFQERSIDGETRNH
jgi:4-amino-4-deoxy-L-arabinose transferase-like glycosyltransferase